MTNNTKRIQWRQALLAISFMGVFFCTLCMLFGVSISFEGFGVDSAGRLYVGVGHRIEVYQDGEMVDTLRKYTSRGYTFTVSPQDTILLCTGSEVLEISLDEQEILSSRPDPRSQIFHDIRKQRTVEDAKGNVYTAYNSLGYLRIYTAEECLYRTPIFDYIVELLFYVSIPCFLISLCLVSSGKQEK